MAASIDYIGLGFAAMPERHTAPADGLKIYRVWGGKSSVYGSGFFSPVKPVSVYEAELCLNVAMFVNEVHFVSTFRLLPHVTYYYGPIAHGEKDLHTDGMQIYLKPPFLHNVRELIEEREVLRHDCFVIQRAGHSGCRRGSTEP